MDFKSKGDDQLVIGSQAGPTFSPPHRVLPFHRLTQMDRGFSCHEEILSYCSVDCWMNKNLFQPPLRNISYRNTFMSQFYVSN